MKRAILIGSSLLSIALSGCGAINAYTGAAINAGESGFTGAKQNIQAIDDARLIGWMDTACTLPVGALQRNATGNPDAVQAVLTACPVPSMALVSTRNGSVSVMTIPAVTAPTPTSGYVAPTNDTAAPASK
jgi:hypothetical protein